MMLSWMVSVVVFTGCLAAGGLAAEPLARAFGRPTRWIWAATLAAAALWPIIVTLARLVAPQLVDRVALQPIVMVVPLTGSLLGQAARAVDIVGPALLALWALASLLLAVRLTRAIVSLHRLRRGAERRIVDGMPVLLTETLGPATIGLRRHSVFVPRALLELEEPLRRLMLRHEREHCSARDPWFLVATAVAVVLFPWNVGLWFIGRRLRLALEIDCDRRVLAAGVDVNRYGQLLLWIAQRRSVIPLASMLAESTSHLERRIVVMHSCQTRARPLHMAAAAVLLALAIAGACSEASLNGPLAHDSTVILTGSAGAPAVMGAPYLEFQVEQQAQQIPNTGDLQYPSAMRVARRQGEVLVQFVVDDRGVPDLTTFKPLMSTDNAFTEAVRRALPTMRFTPARVGGAAVAQIVQQPFTFALSSP